ncbi:Type II secretion system protein G precursor [compost metagenome]
MTTMWARNKQKTGFTIVELLIVIVIIGILAAITIVAYNGIQQRANNSSTITAVNQTVKAISSYIATNNTYPSTGALCLVPSTTCTAGGTAIAVSQSTIDSIQTVANLPKSISSARPEYAGIVYNYGSTRTFNGQSQPAVLFYSLLGDAQSCGVANTTNSGGTVMSSGNYAVSGGGYTTCVVSIQGPAHS